jgi:hypothetical protein
MRYRATPCKNDATGFGGSFGQEDEFKNAANANYNALQLSLTQQSAAVPILGNMYYTLGYTWAHSIDDASGFRQGSSTVPFSIPTSFGRHRISISGNT